MNNKFLYIFLNFNTATVIRIENNSKEILFSNAKFSLTKKILEDLRNFHHYKIKLVLGTTQTSIKTFNTTGMNFWHRYQLKQRLKKEFYQSDWCCMWEENSTLIMLKGTLSSDEKRFLEALKKEKFLIVSSVHSLWLIHHNLLKGHSIKNNGIVIAPLSNYFQHILYLNGLPINSRISKDDNVNDWLQFISAKYKISLEILNISPLVTLTEDSCNCLTSLPLNYSFSKAPIFFFAKQYAVECYYKCVNLFNQIIYGSAIAAILVVTYNVNGLLEIKNLTRSLKELTKTQERLFSDIPNSTTSIKDFEKYIAKRKIVETFNHQTFPSMSFLERISTILPDYGQINYISIIPAITNNREGSDLKDNFLIKIKITPFKNSKDLQLLTGEIHKHFGEKIQIHLLRKQPKVLTEQQLNHTIEINLTGFIHDIQRLTY